jgi:hypothetical protein
VLNAPKLHRRWRSGRPRYVDQPQLGVKVLERTRDLEYAGRQRNVFAFDLANSARLWTVHIHVSSPKMGIFKVQPRFQEVGRPVIFPSDEALSKTKGNVIVSRGGLVDTKISVAADRWLMARKSPGSHETEMTTKDLSVDMEPGICKARNYAYIIFSPIYCLICHTIYITDIKRCFQLQRRNV